MDYITQHQLLKKDFNSDKELIRIKDLSTRIVNCRFESRFPTFEAAVIPDSSLYDPELIESRSPQNESFTYPVIISEQTGKSDSAILMLHGLNERSWDKYLVWAKYLSEETGQAVILFPIAFHMNRSPEKWSDARAMSQVVALRKSLSPGLKDATYVNAALSARIENHPEQFMISGMQSYLDVVRLVASIKEGSHPLFREGTRINIFSYSIGAFLSELLVMDNPRNLFDDTKLCLFCGGATFDHLNGASRFIMDSRAFQRLRSLADLKNFKRMTKHLNLPGFSEFRNTWETLRFMTFLKEGRTAREQILQKIGERIYAIGLSHDKVVPASAILLTLKGHRMNLPTRVDILDFPYPYTHESPFPLNNQNLLAQVDTCFRQVFSKVTGFLK